MKPIYTMLSRIRPLAGNYALKFLFVAFLGIHVPLLGVIAVIAWGQSSGYVIICTALGCTLLACFLTLYILKGLLDPLHYSYLALSRYLSKQELPHLPLQYPDEAGRLMQKIQITIQRLDSLLKEKYELAALFSHDVRTPLANMVGLSRLILEEHDINIIHDYTHDIAKLAEQQLDVVKSILEKMRATEVKADVFKLKRVMVRSLAENVCKVASMQLQAKRISIVNKIGPELSISLDEEEIGHVILNLLTNAIKFSYPGSVIELTADAGKEFLRIHVRDYGIGFDKAQGDELFKMYTTFGRMGTAGEPSLGMGLYLAKKIMEKHGGAVKASSSGPGCGALFSMIFPLSNDLSHLN